MKKLTWWFRIVGVIYALLGIGFVPALNAQRLLMMVPDFDAPLGGVAYHALLDYSFMFGLDMLVIGVYLLYASRRPRQHLTLVGLLVALEVVRGILDDLYMIARGYNPAFMAGFIVLHLLIIVPGIAFARQVQGERASGLR